MQTHFLIWWCLCCVHATNDKRQPANDTSYMVLWVPERLATQSYTSAKDVHMTTSILLKNIQTFCTFLCLAWITCSSVWLVHLYPPHRDLIFRIYKSKPSASIHYIRRYILFYWWLKLCEHDDDNESETITTTYLIYIAISAGANLLNQLVFILWIPSRYIRAQQIRCTCYWCWTMMCRCHVSFVFNPLFDSRLWIQYQLIFLCFAAHLFYSILWWIFNVYAISIFLYYFSFCFGSVCASVCVFVLKCASYYFFFPAATAAAAALMSSSIKFSSK